MAYPQEKKFIYDEETFGLRLAKLREQKDISAREMSLELGQNKNYINAIESGKNFPSMKGFLCICDFIGISPMDFFNENIQNIYEVEKFAQAFQRLEPEHAEHLYLIAQDLVKTKHKN